MLIFIFWARKNFNLLFVSIGIKFFYIVVFPYICWTQKVAGFFTKMFENLGVRFGSGKFYTTRCFYVLCLLSLIEYIRLVTNEILSTLGKSHHGQKSSHHRMNFAVTFSAFFLFLIIVSISFWFWFHFILRKDGWPKWKEFGNAFLLITSETKLSRKNICFSHVIQRMITYSNLRHYINHHHQPIIAERAALPRKRPPNFVTSFAYPCKTLSFYAWLECIDRDLQPFLFVVNNVIEKPFRNPPIMVHTLMKYQ